MHTLSPRTTVCRDCKMSSGTENPLKKAAKFTLALFSIGFIFSKCMMKSAVDRIPILRNKTQLVLKQASRGIALFLESGRPKMSSGAGSPWNKATKFTLSLFSTRFYFSKCMMAAKSAIDGILLLGNKMQVVLKHMRRATALFLESVTRTKMSSRAESPWKTVAKPTFSIFSAGFNSSKCTMAATSAVDRIQLLRNKTLVEIEHMRFDIALLLKSGQDSRAHTKVQVLIAKHNFVVASWSIELYCELIVNRRLLIAEQRECPEDLKEAISGLIFTASRRSDIPELLTLRNNFEKKYGRDFVRAAIQLRPGCCVLRMLSANLTSRPPGEVKMKVLKEIAKEFKIQWDPTKSETELLKPREMLYY